MNIYTMHRTAVRSGDVIIVAGTRAEVVEVRDGGRETRCECLGWVALPESVTVVGSEQVNRSEQ